MSEEDSDQVAELATQAHVLTRNETRDLLVCGMTRTQLSHTDRGMLSVFSCIPMEKCLFKSFAYFVIVFVVVVELSPVIFKYLVCVCLVILSMVWLAWALSMCAFVSLLDWVGP